MQISINLHYHTKVKSKKIYWVISTALLLIIVAGLVFLGLSNKPKLSSKTPMIAVAAENFWGSLLSQIGGSKVQVTSIVTDPNADPHEYESNTTDARVFAQASYVVINGAGYDSWANNLLNANPTSGRKVLNVASLLQKKNGSNPHFWYSPAYVNTVLAKMEQDLISLDPRDKSYFVGNFVTLKASLNDYQNIISLIKRNYGGVKVAATEDIFSYLASASGLNLVSPKAFMQAVSEGNDPPASSVVTFEQQLTNNTVKLLVYNTQTVTPLTLSMKQLAQEHNIPVVGVSETIQPPNSSFQSWMSIEVTKIKNALGNG